MNFAEPVFLLVDRLAVSPDGRARIVDAVESGYREAGEVIFETAPREGERRSGCASRSGLSASTAICVTRSRNRGCFRSTTPMARVRAARDSATPSISTSTWSFRTRSKTLNEGAIEPWTKPKYRSLLTELKRFARQAGIPHGRALGRT